MNPALYKVVTTAMSEVMHCVFVEQELPYAQRIHLDLIASLMFHGVISESPEELADILVSDFRAVVQNAGERLPHKVERDSHRLFLKALRISLQGYQEELIRKGVNPNTLPRVRLPEERVPATAREDEDYV